MRSLNHIQLYSALYISKWAVEFCIWIWVDHNFLPTTPDLNVIEAEGQSSLDLISLHSRISWWPATHHRKEGIFLQMSSSENVKQQTSVRKWLLPRLLSLRPPFGRSRWLTTCRLYDNSVSCLCDDSGPTTVNDPHSAQYSSLHHKQWTNYHVGSLSSNLTNRPTIPNRGRRNIPNVFVLVSSPIICKNSVIWAPMVRPFDVKIRFMDLFGTWKHQNRNKKLCRKWGYSPGRLIIFVLI